MTHPCADLKCNQDREAKMVTVSIDMAGKPVIWCDPCIAPIVAALNIAGIATEWSCCGHGQRPACIGLKNGWQIVIAQDLDELHLIDTLFPKDINGNPSGANLWGWFGLSYASWLTLPRVLMHAMPESWQRAMATLLRQYDDAFPNQPGYGTQVQLREGNRLVKAPDWLLNYRHPDQRQIDACRATPANEAAE